MVEFQGFGAISVSASFAAKFHLDRSDCFNHAHTTPLVRSDDLGLVPRLLVPLAQIRKSYFAIVEIQEGRLRIELSLAGLEAAVLPLHQRPNSKF